MASNMAQLLIEASEENFKYETPEEAFRLAILAKQDRLIAAYGIHVAAAWKNSNGDINWFAVLGILDPLAHIQTIDRNYKKLALLVHPDKNNSVAAESAFRLILDAWNVLSQPSSRKDYDLRASSSSPTYGGRPCPTCNGWCNYENKNCSSIYCSNCCRKYVFRSSSADSSSGAAGTGSSDAAYSHSHDPSAARYSSSSTAAGDAGFSTVTPAVCPFCSTHCVYQCAERVSITCPNCSFGFTSSKRACMLSFGNGRDASFCFKSNRCC